MAGRSSFGCAAAARDDHTSVWRSNAAVVRWQVSRRVPNARRTTHQSPATHDVSMATTDLRERGGADTAVAEHTGHSTCLRAWATPAQLVTAATGGLEASPRRASSAESRRGEVRERRPFGVVAGAPPSRSRSACTEQARHGRTQRGNGCLSETDEAWQRVKRRREGCDARGAGTLASADGCCADW